MYSHQILLEFWWFLSCEIMFYVYDLGNRKHMTQNKVLIILKLGRNSVWTRC